MHIVTRFRRASLCFNWYDYCYRLGQETNVSRPSYGRQFSYSSYNDSESSQGSSEGGAGEDDSDQFTQVSLLLIQGSHQSGKSGNSGKFLKTFSRQGNQGKIGGFQPKSEKNIWNQGTFFQNYFQPFKPFSLRKETFFKWGGFTFGKCICNKLVFL